MRHHLLPFTASAFLALGEVTAQSAPDALASARNALAESLPDIAATRIERYLATNTNLPTDQKATVQLLLGESYLRSKKPDQALTILSKIPNSHLSPRSYWQGLALAAQEKLAQGAQKLTLVIPKDPLYPQALFNQIELFFRLENWPAAFEALRKLQAHSPDFQVEKLAQLEAQLFLSTKQPEKALAALTAVTTSAENEQEQALKKILQGRIALALSDYATAQQAFIEAQTLSKSPSLKTLALLGKSDANLKSEQAGSALPSLLTLLEEPDSSLALPFLHSRFETLITQLENPQPLRQALLTFASPQTLGEDSNYTTEAKLFACYYLSLLSPPAEATSYLTQILTLSPSPKLTALTHFQQARTAYENKQLDESKKSLEKVRTIAPNSPLAAQAADLLGRLATKEGQITKAQNLFAQATSHPISSFAEQALLNQALLQLSLRPESSTGQIADRLTTEDSQTLLSLERALALASKKSDLAHNALQEFLLQNPAHPRLNEARLALARLALAQDTPNFSLVESQLAALPENSSSPLSHQSFQVAHRLGVMSNDWSHAVKIGEKYRKQFAEAKDDPFFTLRLAESCFQNGDYNRAHFLFSEVVNHSDSGELAELALLYSARSNLLIPTGEATVEALDTLDQVIAKGGPLTNRARLLKARTLLKSLGQAEESLRTLDGIPGRPGDQPEASLLAAEAYRELAATEPKSAALAISIYQRLLDDDRTSYPLSNRIHYQLALTHRENGKLNLAIEPCLRVVDFENKLPNEKEQEWDYYYRCGFEAIDILLEAKRPQAALTLARKLAQTNGPGAPQAQERAEQIQLDHLIWNE